MAKLEPTLSKKAIRIILDPRDFKDLCWDKEVIFYDAPADLEVTVRLDKEYHENS